MSLRSVLAEPSFVKEASPRKPTGENLFKRCVKAWGVESQVMMLAEESGELTVATLHLLRNLKQNDALQHFAEEVADVEFMLAQLKYILPDLESMVAVWRSRKEVRLRKILTIRGN